MARHESEGVWTVEGNRGIILYRDHILRFENLSIPYLSECSRSSDLQTEWDGIEDEDKLVLWDAMADASRLQLLASGDLVLVAEPEHWIGISKQQIKTIFHHKLILRSFITAATALKKILKKNQKN